MEFDIIKYRKLTVVKIIITTLMIAIPILIAAAIIPYYINVFLQAQDSIPIDTQQAEFAGKYSALLLIIFIEVICVYKLSCFIRVETNEEYARKYYIKTHDEREQYISREANALAMKFSLYVVGVCAAIAGCFDIKVFIALISVFFAEIAIYICSYLYFRYKN